MAIHLHTKYADQLARLYTKNSLLEGHTNNMWSFSGLKSLLIPSIVTQPLKDYVRSGTSRYGTPQDLQDTVQEMTMTQDKAFSIVIDKGDNSEQQMMKRAAEVMKQQVAEQVVPLVDQYALDRWFHMAGTVKAIAEPTASTIVSDLLDAEVYLNDHFVPDEERWAYVQNKYIKMIRLSDEFTGCDSIVRDMVVKGYAGNLGTLKIVGVPERYMPKDTYFLVAHRDAVILAQKLRDGRIHQDPPGISGHLLEGRYNYDAFVIGARADGVYAAVKSGTVCGAVTATKGSTTALTCATDGATILYTLDGSDPRYSTAARTYTAPIANPEAGTVLKAYARKEGMFPGAVLEHTCA